MAQIHKVDAEFQVKCTADKFYGVFVNNVTHLSKVLPDIYKSIKVLEGDGKSVGTVRLWKYAQGNRNALVCKEKLKAVDDKNRSVTFHVFEGDLTTHYVSIDLTLSVTPKVTEGSLVKWRVEFEKKTQDVPPPDAFID